MLTKARAYGRSSARRTISLCGLLVAGFGARASAQNLIVDPYFKTSSAWTVLNTARTNVVAWGPLKIETKTTMAAHAGQVVGVKQVVTVPRDGHYQLAIHVDTEQVGPGRSVEFQCELRSGSTSVLAARGSANPGGDTAMRTALLKAGRYELFFTSKTIYGSPAASHYLLLARACSLRAVELPVADWRLVSGPFPTSRWLGVTANCTPKATSVIYLFAARKLQTGARIPGMGGLLWLDPTGPGGIIASGLVSKTNSISVAPWPSPWPRLHCQVLELEAGLRVLRLGSSRASFD